LVFGLWGSSFGLRALLNALAVLLTEIDSATLKAIDASASRLNEEQKANLDTILVESAVKVDKEGHFSFANDKRNHIAQIRRTLLGWFIKVYLRS